jgi:hypothetical protein
MNTINLHEWNISYTELVQWAEETGSEIFAFVHHGGAGPSATYGFEKEEDLLAFKLKFAKEERPIMGFNGTTANDIGAYYAPYIPFNK